MRVYTPPEYDLSDQAYPVLYLIHGDGDDDRAWSTIGRAGTVVAPSISTSAPIQQFTPTSRLVAESLSRDSSVERLIQLLVSNPGTCYYDAQLASTLIAR
jgi:hypothetical protein